MSSGTLVFEVKAHEEGRSIEVVVLVWRREVTWERKVRRRSSPGLEAFVGKFVVRMRVGRAEGKLMLPA